MINLTMHYLGTLYLLAQEFIEGREFAVNAVSFFGHVRITAIWQYHKQTSPTGDFIYDFEELIDPTLAEYTPLVAYVKQVVKALGIQFGPSHTEVMMDANGPVLIECAARIDGIANPVFDREILDHGQHELALASFQIEKNKIDFADRYKRIKFASNVSLISARAGRLNSIQISKYEGALQSYVGHLFKFKIGDHVRKTKDIFSSPGVLFLAHSDEKVVKADFAKIRELEQTNALYEITNEN